MGISKTITEALNKQFNEELNSAYIYQAVAAGLLREKPPRLCRLDDRAGR